MHVYNTHDKKMYIYIWGDAVHNLVFGLGKGIWSPWLRGRKSRRVNFTCSVPPRILFDRAVQAGKGPAPRHKGASVGALRDSAVRHLRGVLVTYAILTIQNPDMWGDEVSVDGHDGRSCFVF